MEYIFRRNFLKIFDVLRKSKKYIYLGEALIIYIWA